MDQVQMPNFNKVFEAWDQKPTTNQNGWTYVPAVGTFPNGPSSHFTYRPNGTLDHYSVYQDRNRIEKHPLY